MIVAVSGAVSGGRWMESVTPYGVDGWRWVVLTGAAGSMVIWILRLYVPESPLCLARHGRTEEAVEILRKLEAAAGTDAARPERMPDALSSRAEAKAGFAELFKPPYLSLVVLFM